MNILLDVVPQRQYEYNACENVHPGENTTKRKSVVDTQYNSSLRTQADAPTDDTSGAYVTATAVTTRTAMTHEDLGTNAKTQQLEEKTVATTRTHNLNRQEQRVVTQEVKTTATVTSGDQVRLEIEKDWNSDKLA